MIMNRYLYLRAYVLTKTSPRPSPPGEGVDSPGLRPPPLRGGRATARCQGLKPLVRVGSPFQG